MSDLAERALERAIGQEQLKDENKNKFAVEKPEKSNWGHPVQDYLSSVGIGFPASWCMAFVYWCFKDAALQLGFDNPLYKTGGVLVQWNKNPDKQNHLIEIGDTGNYKLDYPLRPGDIMIMDHGHGLGHTGIVQSINADGTINTIEGNTNDTGSREGIEVDKKIRHLRRPIIGFLRF